ncbi:hypothetical protein [Priestia taiwanensis]|uniref:Uncharacterized protein n=1 Tax=Priestia taiwanensis TaxID=1347902 RepID=A0A917EMH2_9BACI|nr:hypothetical protein [Priestia taiwanensis]MBM7362345.1 hypothetical protein [Priestia taiwanensis]GGE61413.1 hypothetical protein GCM10007140_09670 [Priestia taiwanensis]
MTKFIDLAEVKKMISEKELKKFGESVVGEKAVASVNGKEQVGSVVYRRKATYDEPFERRA